jgi:hypothetical protein
LSNCKWLGHAQFEGNFFAIYFITFCQFIDCVFDFDYIKTTGTASRDLYIWGHPSLTSTIVVNCNKIDSFGGNGNAIGILGLVEGAINIREKLIAYYNPYTFGFPGFAASEKLVINCPLTIMRNGGWAGTNISKAVAYVLGATSVMDIEINSKLVVESGVTFGSVAGIITTWAGGSSGKIVWNGDKIAPSMPRGIYNTRPTTKVISRGDIYLPDGRLVETTNSGEVNIEQGNSVFSLSSLLGSTGTTYLKDFHIHAIGVGQNIFDLNTNSHNLYMDGVVAEGDGGAGLLVN